jgi:uncharacterized membrane protein YqjE
MLSNIFKEKPMDVVVTMINVVALLSNVEILRTQSYAIQLAMIASLALIFVILVLKDAER